MRYWKPMAFVNKDGEPIIEYLEVSKAYHEGKAIEGYDKVIKSVHDKRQKEILDSEQ